MEYLFSSALIRIIANYLNYCSPVLLKLLGAAIDVDFLKRGSCTTSMIHRVGDFSRQLFSLLSEGDFDKSQWTGKQQLHGGSQRI